MCEIQITTPVEHDNTNLYKAKCNALSRELDDAIEDNDRLRSQNRKYRTDRMKAYRTGITGNEWSTIKWLCIACYGCGMITSLIIVVILMLFA